MSARDELAKIIQSEYVRAIDRKRPQDCWNAPADAIVAAGYRKPRTITTVEELEALPYMSLVMSDERGYPEFFERLDDGFAATGSESAGVVQLPAIVLYEPVPGSD